MDRRTMVQTFLTGFAGLAASGGFAGCTSRAAAQGSSFSAFDAEGFASRMQEIEIASGGRLGVAVMNTQTGAQYGHRGDERFPMCSTFKLVAAALVLRRVDGKEESLDRPIRFGPADLVPHSPVTTQHVAQGAMTIADLCEATITQSDNAAANLLMRTFGGPAGLTAYLRSIGDEVTRLDRIEPDLNEAVPGDLRDTTTPNAMLGTMRNIVLGNALSPASRTQITRWLLANKTGDRRLRALLPIDWRVADKTGAGANGTNNDVAVMWPSTNVPVLVCSYLTGTKAPAAASNKTLAEVGRLVALTLQTGNGR